VKTGIQDCLLENRKPKDLDSCFRRNDEKETKWRRKPYNMVKRYRKILTDAKEKIERTSFCNSTL
jgi:hypothetical protein